MARAAVQSVQIIGITVQLEKPLDHSVIIELTVDGNDSRSMELKAKEMPVGDHSLQPPLPLRQGSVLSIHIQEKHQGKGDQTLSQFLVSPETIWLVSGQNMPNDRTKNFLIHLIGPEKRLIWLNVVEFPSIPPPDANSSGQDIPVPEDVSRTQEEAGKPLRDASQNVVQKLGEFKVALERLGGEKTIVESVKFEGVISELHQFSKLVFDSVNAFYAQIETQGEGDRELLALAFGMERTVNLIQPVKDIVELNESKKTLEIFPDLMKETIDFIEIWAKHSVFAKFILIQSNKDKVDDLNKRYASFEEEFSQGIQIDATAKTDSPLKPHELKELKDILLDGIKSVKPKAIPCIPGTRTTILEEVEAKIDDHDSPSILWIRGAPGSGKSSLSLSAKSWLHDEGRLVTYFRFDRNESTTTTATALWRRIAYNLSSQIPAVGRHVLQQLQDPNFEFDSPMTVFTSLVETPLSELISLSITRSLVVVIDALDECGGSDGRLSSERKEFLQTLRHWPKLPKNLKLLVTSREESDIIRTLSTISTPIHIPSGISLIENPRDPASIAASEDIRIFLEYRFFEIKTQLDDDGDWPGSKMIGGMVHRAAGNFMWATTAVNFIDEGIDPEDRLDRIMSDTSLSSSMEPLYSLYCTILETAFGKVADNDLETVILRTVLATMICAKRTLSDNDYIKLPTQGPISRRTLASIRNSLRSVIVADGNLRFVHKSFDDFLRSTLCPPKYAVNVDTTHHLLTNLCLTTMEDGLRFNLCDLTTSCLKNIDVPDIETKIFNSIPTLLSYSCCFWADHLSLAPSDQHLMSEVKVMVRDKLLYWFEAMSLLKEINRVSPSLLLVLKWFHSSPDDQFKEFISDARRFIAAFGHPIAQSAPHIYISALPFAPKNSPVAQHYLPRFPRTFALTVGKPTDWPPCIFVLKPNDFYGPVISVTLSPDERYIVSGSQEGKFFISDSETGNLVSGPFQTDWDFSPVFFDPDGRYIWVSCKSGGLIGFDIETGEEYRHFKVGHAIGFCRSNGGENIVSIEGDTVILWSADTGRRLCDLSMGVNPRVRLATLSPNGRYIAAAVTYDNRETVGMWSLVDGSEIQLVRGASVKQTRPTLTTLSFSADSNFAVSGSRHGTIQIWDAKTGDPVGAPQSTGRHRLLAVAYSHENRHLICLNDKSTATVWNTSTCEAVLVPLSLNNVTSIALSRDGRRAVLGTSEGVVTKWDLDRKGNAPGTLSNGPRTGHVLCFAFSPCGKKLASLHSHSEIRFWEGSTFEPLPGRITLPSDYYRLIFSPDGSQVVTYNPVMQNGGLRVWNANTGELAFHQEFDGNRFMRHVAFRSTDQWLVACSDYGHVFIRNLEHSAPPPVTKIPWILALSPDGLTAIVRDNNGNPRHSMWSTITYQPIPLTLADGDHIKAVCYPSTGPLLAATSYKANFHGPSRTTLQVWNTQTGDLTAGPSTIHGEIRCLAFSSDNSHIAFSLVLHHKTTIWIWDTRAGCVISGFWSIHTSNITALDFSPDGERLISGSADGQIKVWNTADLLGSSPVPVDFMCGGMGIQDGWFIVEGKKLGFWVPPDHREKLAWNGIVAVLGGEDSGIITHVDLTRFRYGENWMECFGEAK